MNILDRNPDPSETFMYKDRSFFWRDIARCEDLAPKILRLVLKDETSTILTDLDGKLKAKLDAHFFRTYNSEAPSQPTGALRTSSL
jgi:hypothetical protein